MRDLNAHDPLDQCVSIGVLSNLRVPRVAARGSAKTDIV